MLTSKTYSIRWSFSSYEPPFGEPLETAEFLNVVPGNLHDVGVRQSVHGIVANGTGQLHRLTGFLRFQLFLMFILYLHSYLYIFFLFYYI